MKSPQAYPQALPEKPSGWTKQLSMHMNFGEAGGAASYTINDADGKETRIGYQYDTRKGGLTGFTLPGVAGVMTWPQLRAKWPEWVSDQTGNAELRGDGPASPARRPA